MTLKVPRESVCVETLESRGCWHSAPSSWAAAQAKPPSAQFARLGWIPQRTRAAGFTRYPTPGPGREPAEGAAWRTAHTEAGTHRSGSWSTCTARPPWRPRAPHRPGPPRGRRPASHPGPGGGVTATAWEQQLWVPGLRLRLARSVWTRQSGRQREAREARPPRQRSRAPSCGH